ncbi:hypothetical protein UFOVP104_8 [uncultured Caudovirales phage]|uniref:Uncharacterized protein n=1 Tax=uncultured Caudovirales phage TaxID=2100421 RepID=A0A6J5L2N2_9CAUD|nr:hypothetical protein UFOVP104_8 [uncultured Caudovirales phage]CAB4134313.1 hypothetical protein UFOVP271_43 [uncultured Caudovirales phage]
MIGINSVGFFASSGGGSAYDADAQAFFTASSITDLTQKNAVNQLVLDLKSNGLWTKMKALYPVVGGNASAHSYNLINTSLYQLSFSSGWTHSSTGMLPNGTSAYADTLFNPSSMGSLNDMHLSFYNRTSTYGGVCLIGAYVGSMTSIYNSGHTNINGSGFVVKTSSNALGLKITSRVSSTSLLLRSNNINESFTSNSTSLPNTNINISRNGGYNSDYSADQCAFASIGLGLTLTDMTNLQNIVNTFQTSLSRNV